MPNRDGADVIGACLRSALAQTWPRGEVIVVDDGSTDSSADLVARDFPAVRLLRLPAPSGFAGACNAGLAAAGGEWIAVLNTDAEADPRWLAEAMAVAETAPAPAMIACRVLSADGATVDSLGMRLTRGGLCLLRGRGAIDAPDDTLPASAEVFGPAGSAALYRASALDAVGFFAPDYFAYYEDADLAWRLRLAGHCCLLAHRARVRHRHSHTAVRVGLDKRYFLQRNRLRTVARNWPASLLLRNLHRLLAADLASIALATLEGRPRAARRARGDFLRGLSADLRSRRGRVTPAGIGDWLGRDAIGGRP